MYTTYNTASNNTSSYTCVRSYVVWIVYGHLGPMKIGFNMSKEYQNRATKYEIKYTWMWRNVLMWFWIYIANDMFLKNAKDVLSGRVIVYI